MQQLPDDIYADPATASKITNWAATRYASPAPSLTGYAPKPTASATPAQPDMATAQPTTWSSAASYQQPAAPGVRPAPAARPAPGIQPAPSRPAPGLRPAPAQRPAPGMLAAPSRTAPAMQAAPGRQSVAPTMLAPTKTAQLGQDDLALRNVDAASETVQGRMSGLMDENGAYMQQARADAMRSANERGMLNSAMAASGGTDAAIRSALPIATTDAATYAGAADYNAALKNQATMWNADQTNQGNRLDTQMGNDAAARAQAKELALMQDDTSRWQEGNRLASSQWETALQNDTATWTEQQRLANSQWEKQLQTDTTTWTEEQRLANSQWEASMQNDTSNWQEQQRLAQALWEKQQQNDITRWTEEQRLANTQWERQVTDATARWQQEQQNANSRYNTDAQYRNQADEQRRSMANNIIQNMDLSPDRKAAMLEALGQGTSAGINPDGSYRPGTGLAGAVYVIDGVSSDLNFGGPSGGPGGGSNRPAQDAASANAYQGSWPGVNEARAQVSAQQAARQDEQDAIQRANERDMWGRGLVDYNYNDM